MSRASAAPSASPGVAASPASGPDDTPAELRDKYAAAGFTNAEIDELLVLDVKPVSYFDGYDSQHAGGAALFAHDPAIMGWLFGA